MYDFLYYYRLTTAKGVYLVRVQSLTVISLLITPPGAIVTPPGVCWIVYRVECAEEFFRLVRARSNNSVVCFGVNFLSCSIAKAVAIASAISSLVAVYRFI